MKTMLKYINRSFALLCCLLLFQSCYNDEGNYNYKDLPEGASIDNESYGKSYTQSFGSTLTIKPKINYNGSSSDLSYKWQIWDIINAKFVTIAEGQNLEYLCGPNDYIKGEGSFTLRLAVSNKQLLTDSSNGSANEIYSELITLTVLIDSYIGLMVLHGDGSYCDVGLIQDKIFMPKATDQITSNVTSNFYSKNNNGQKVAGEGRQIVKQGYVFNDIWGKYGSSSILIFTDKTGISAQFQTLVKADQDYSSIFLDPNYSQGKPQAYIERGQAQGRAFIDNGKVFYGNFIGPLFNPNFEYDAAPYPILIGNGGFSIGTSMGVVVFDKLSKGFLYSLNGSNNSTLYKFPNSVVSEVEFQPNNMKADLIYAEQSVAEGVTRAVMKDEATGERYLAVLNLYAGDRSKIAAGKYSMESLPEINNVKFYAFGGGINVSYYASKSEIFQYSYEGSNTAKSIYNVTGGEEITSMRILKHEYSQTSTYYQYSNRILIVSTVNSLGNGKIHAFSIDKVTGGITLLSSFNGTENGGKPFGRIYDTNIKIQ